MNAEKDYPEVGIIAVRIGRRYSLPKNNSLESILKT